MNFLLITLFFGCLFARPTRPVEREGEVRNFKNQRRFTYDNSKLKSVEFSKLHGNSQKYPQEPIIKYDIELTENYHSLDEEEIIDKVECSKDSVELYSTEKLNDWKNGDVFTGGDMWNCQYGLMRKIVSIEYEGEENNFHHYFVKTQNAEIKDIFTKADVDYHFPTKNDFSEEIDEIQNKRKLKRSSYSVDIISPTEETVVDSEIGLEVAFSLQGCDALECGDVTVEMKIYYDRTWPVSNILRTTYVGTCTAETNYNCRFLVPMKDGEYGYDENDFVKIEFYKNGESFLSKTIDFKTNENKFIFELPNLGTVMSMDDLLNVTWDVTSATLRRCETVDIKIYKQIDWWFDSHITTITVNTADYYLGYRVTEANGFEKGATYYMKVDLDNGEDYQSHTFYIDDGSDSIQLITPDCTTFISKGEVLTIGWEYRKELDSNTITIRVIRAISFWPDDTVYENENVDITNTELSIDVGSWKESTKYYVEIEYQAEGKKHIAYSDYFTYSTAKIFTVSSSTTDEKNRVIRINMKVNQYIGKYYVSVHQKFPVFSMLDYEIEGTEQKEIKEYNVGETYTQSFSYTQGSPFKAYVEFRYRCLYKDHLCDEEKYYITDVPYEETIFQWNYNTLTHSITDKSIDIAKYTCANGVNTEQVGTSFTDICNKLPGFDFEFSTTCENCYVWAPVKAFGFQLLINAGYAYKAKLNLEADMQLNLDILSTLRGEYHFDYNKELTEKMNFKIRIALGPVLITIQPGMQFFFDFTLDSIIMLEAEASFNKDYTLLLSFDSTQPTLKDQFKLTATNNDPGTAVEGHVAGSVDVAIEPMITAQFWLDCKCYGVAFIEAGIEFKVGTDIEMAAQYPAFPVDNVYSSDYPYYIRLDTSFFLKYNYDVTIFDNVLAEKAETDLVNGDLDNKFAFGKVKGNSEAVTMSLPLSSSYGKLSDLEMSTLKYEIGLLSQAIAATKYDIVDISAYMVHGELDSTRSNESVNYYNFNDFDTLVDETIMKDVKTCLTGGSCVVNLETGSYPTISKIKSSILDCQLSGCSKCSLDETTCSA